MRCRRVGQDSHDLSLGKNVPVIQGQQKRLADGERGNSGHVGDSGHRVSTFCRGSGMMLALVLVPSDLHAILAGNAKRGLIWVSIGPQLLRNKTFGIS